ACEFIHDLYHTRRPAPMTRTRPQHESTLLHRAEHVVRLGLALCRARRFDQGREMPAELVEAGARHARDPHSVELHVGRCDVGLAADDDTRPFQELRSVTTELIEQHALLLRRRAAVDRSEVAEDHEHACPFPAFGKPTSAASAISFSSSCNHRSSPYSPCSAKLGARRAFDKNRALPRPPRPPRAASQVSPWCTRSASSSPSSERTTVPSGTSTTRSAPPLPCNFWPRPWVPDPALRCG